MAAGLGKGGCIIQCELKSTGGLREEGQKEGARVLKGNLGFQVRQ